MRSFLKLQLLFGCIWVICLDRDRDKLPTQIDGNILSGRDDAVYLHNHHSQRLMQLSGVRNNCSDQLTLKCSALRSPSGICTCGLMHSDHCDRRSWYDENEQRGVVSSAQKFPAFVGLSRISNMDRRRTWIEGEYVSAQLEYHVLTVIKLVRKKMGNTMMVSPIFFKSSSIAALKKYYRYR